MRTTVRFLYQVALTAGAVVVGPLLLLRRRHHYSSSIRDRLGLRKLPETSGTSHLWIHAVSVGEVGVAATLAARLGASLPLLVTTVTPTGQATARSRFPDAVVTYLPFDLGFIVRRFFRHFHPRFVVLTEGDLWPTVLHHAQSRGIPVVVVNGRVSDRSFGRMRRFNGWLSPLFEPVEHFGVQTDADRDRLLALGVSPSRITVTGNLKFDSPKPVLGEELADAITRLAAGRPVLVAGSTMPGEEELVLEAFERLGAGDRAMLIIAPRHPERWNAVEQLLDQSAFPWLRRSRVTDASLAAPSVVLLDTLGELAALYQLADAAFIGGTLVETGGHNPLEAACFGVPVVTGRSMENFKEIEQAFDEASAWARVDSADQLAACWSGWLERPADATETGRRGLALIERHRGAVDRTLALLEPWLAQMEQAP